MQIFSVIAAAALSLAGTAHAWTRDPATGIWVANSNTYIFTDRLGNKVEVDEACTHRDTNEWLEHWEDCAYWVNNEGLIHYGKCKAFVRPVGDPANIVNCE